MAWDDDIKGPGGIRYGVWIPRDPNYVKKQEQKAPEPPKAPANDWIKIKVVDDQSGEVIPKVKLSIKTPGNATEDHETRLSGLIESLGLQSGNCELSCDLKDATIDNTLSFVGVDEKPIGPKVDGASAVPNAGTKYIASIEEHKVKTGETLKSIASSAGISWQALAKFNWGTEDPEEINKHLHWSVGCTKKAGDGKNYIFDNSDDPGILYVPKKWTKEGLATNQQYVVRVKQIVGELCIRLDINPNDAKTVNDTFRLFCTDNSVERIKTISDDATPGDTYVDLVFENLPKALRYSLEVDPGKEGKPFLVLDDVPCFELHHAE